MTALRWILLATVGLLFSCAELPSAITRTQQADKLAQQAGWVPVTITTPEFMLRSYQPQSLQQQGAKSVAGSLTIYIEGDGLAWLNSSTPSLNPTPLDPLALKLALRDYGNVVYLARPCQFIDQKKQSNCRNRYWTSHRFAPEVIAATSAAIDQLKQKFAADKLVLVGYSGGGAVSALVSARRSDVSELITIAGNLDHRRWTARHRLSPLSGSLNPADFRHLLTHIPQTHFVGERDTNIDPEFAQEFVYQVQWKIEPRVIVIPDFDHRHCWEEVWPAIKEQPPKNNNPSPAECRPEQGRKR